MHTEPVLQGSLPSPAPTLIPMHPSVALDQYLTPSERGLGSQLSREIKNGFSTEEWRGVLVSVDYLQDENRSCQLGSQLAQTEDNRQWQGVSNTGRWCVAWLSSAKHDEAVTVGSTGCFLLWLRMRDGIKKSSLKNVVALKTPSGFNGVTIFTNQVE